MLRMRAQPDKAGGLKRQAYHPLSIKKGYQQKIPIDASEMDRKIKMTIVTKTLLLEDMEINCEN